MSLLTGFLAFVTAIAGARRSSDAPKTPEADFIARIEHQREIIEAQNREIAALGITNRALMQSRPNEAVEVPVDYIRAATVMLNPATDLGQHWGFCTCTPSRADVLLAPSPRPRTF